MIVKSAKFMVEFTKLAATLTCGHDQYKVTSENEKVYILPNN